MSSYPYSYLKKSANEATGQKDPSTSSLPPYSSASKSWFDRNYNPNAYDGQVPLNKEQQFYADVPIGGLDGVVSLFKPTTFSRIGATTPRAQFENMYGTDLTENLRQDAISWQNQNPAMQGEFTPVYQHRVWNREIPVYSPKGQGLTSINAAYFRPSPPDNSAHSLALRAMLGLAPKEGFLEVNPDLNIYGISDQASRSTPSASSQALQAMGSSRAQNSDGSSYIQHTGKSLIPTIGVHEATHSLQPGTMRQSTRSATAGKKIDPSVEQAAFPDTQRGLLNYVKNVYNQDPIWSQYGLSPVEMPAHISEMKAQYYRDTGTEPYMRTPEQREAFLNYWDGRTQDPDAPKFMLERYNPLMRYLRAAPPAHTENILRSIVQNSSYNSQNQVPIKSSNARSLLGPAIRGAGRFVSAPPAVRSRHRTPSTTAGSLGANVKRTLSPLAKGMAATTAVDAATEGYGAYDRISQINEQLYQGLQQQGVESQQARALADKATWGTVGSTVTKTPSILAESSDKLVDNPINAQVAKAVDPYSGYSPSSPNTALRQGFGLFASGPFGALLKIPIFGGINKLKSTSTNLRHALDFAAQNPQHMAGSAVAQNANDIFKEFTPHERSQISAAYKSRGAPSPPPANNIVTASPPGAEERDPGNSRGLHAADRGLLGA